MWLRDWTVQSSRDLVEPAADRAKLGTIRRRKYDAIASMSPEQRLAACKLAEATVDRFIQLLLTLLAGTGVDQRLGEQHAVCFRLVMEILRVDTHEIVHEEILNRDGAKFFGDYWGRWLNRLGEQSEAGECNGDVKRE
jgi:hypothetical protein